MGRYGTDHDKKLECCIFSIQLGADQMPDPLREGQLMCTLFLNLHQ